MSDEELDEPGNTPDNSDGSDAPATDDSAKAEKSWKPSDERFKDGEALEKSYGELESKLGNHQDTEKKAKRYEASVKALAAEKGVSFEEAEKLLDDETTGLLRKHGQAIADTETKEELRRTNLRLDKRELLDEYPESQEVINRVMDLAKRTGEEPRKIYERDFKSLIDKSMNNQPNPNRQVRRHPDSDERPNRSGEREKELVEKLKNSKPGDFNDDMEAVLKERRFGGK